MSVRVYVTMSISFHIRIAFALWFGARAPLRLGYAHHCDGNKPTDFCDANFAFLILPHRTSPNESYGGGWGHDMIRYDQALLIEPHSSSPAFSSLHRTLGPSMLHRDYIYVYAGGLVYAGALTGHAPDRYVHYALSEEHNCDLDKWLK